MIEIDGSQGEGGGQVLRSALGLSMATGQSFRMTQIRAGRRTPGLMKQHHTAVEAAALISGAEVTGSFPGSTSLEFHPGRVVAGTHDFDIGSAGSAILVFQTLLPALLTLPEPTVLTLHGGTHNPFAPSFEFLERSYLPCLRRMGVEVHAELIRPGFFPAGGGVLKLRVEPATSLSKLDLLDCGEVAKPTARVLLSRLRAGWAEEGIQILRDQLGLSDAELETVSVPNPIGPGNAFLVESRMETFSAVFTGIADRRASSGDAARAACAEALAWSQASVPVDEHLADQLLLPLALAGGGSFRTTEPSGHARTHADILGLFLPVRVRFEKESDRAWRAEVGRGSVSSTS